MHPTLTRTWPLLLAGLAIAWTLGPPAGWSARADEPGTSTAWLCRTFKHPLESDHRLDTTDRTSDVGQWIFEEARRGWRVQDIDLEVSQKSSGFPMGLVQVCLTRTSS